MEFLKTIKRRSFINEAIYVLLNIGLSVALLLIVRTTGSMWLAFLLVALSKWRIFAVRPRFWFANIQANMVSVIVSVSFVVFLYITNSANIGDWQTLTIQLILVMFDIGWLLFLKAQSKRVYIVLQSGVALFAGITAIFALSYGLIASPVVLLSWLVGYSTAEHILSSYDEESHTVLLSLAWGLGVTEICWLAYHWTIAYRLPIAKDVLIPQVSIILLCFSFLVYKSYDSYSHHQKIRINDIILPLFFTISIICILMFFFNGVSTKII